MDPSLVARLRHAGVDPEAIDDPQAAFLDLVAASPAGTSLDDRLALEAQVLRVGVDALPAAARRRAVEGFYRQRWDGFEIVGEERDDPIEIVEYDPEWPDRFKVWRDRLAAALGDAAVRIEHVGSTAVVGLAAKPIVDIHVSVSDLENEARYVPQIERAGVALRSRDAEHRYFRPPPLRPRDVHIHVCRRGTEWERTHLLFRDYLRAHDSVRDEYAALKHELLARHPNDRLSYTEAKTAFITSTLRAAAAWRRALEGERAGPSG